MCLNVFERGVSLSADSDDLLVFIKQYILILPMVTVCIHGLGATVNISSSVCINIHSCGRIYTNVQRCVEFAYLSKNKKQKKKG